MTHLHRIAGIGVLGVLAWASACANHDTACVAPYAKSCGEGADAVCCQECDGAGCKGASQAATSSGNPYANKDPECEGETDFTKTKFCGGKCVDVRDDDQNCGACGVVCGEDTNGIQKTCFVGKCQ